MGAPSFNLHTNRTEGMPLTAGPSLPDIPPHFPVVAAHFLFGPNTPLSPNRALCFHVLPNKPTRGLTTCHRPIRSLSVIGYFLIPSRQVLKMDGGPHQLLHIFLPFHPWIPYVP